MIINMIYETHKSSFAVACFLPGQAKDLPAPLHTTMYTAVHYSICYHFARL